MLGIIIIPLSTMVTCKETHAVIIALHKKDFTGKDIDITDMLWRNLHRAFTVHCHFKSA